MGYDFLWKIYFHHKGFIYAFNNSLSLNFLEKIQKQIKEINKKVVKFINDHEVDLFYRRQKIIFEHLFFFKLTLKTQIIKIINHSQLQNYLKTTIIQFVFH